MRKKILFVCLTVFFVLSMFGQEYFVNKRTSNHDLFDLGLDEHKDLNGGEIIDCIPDTYRSMGAERRNDEYTICFSGELDGSEILVNVKDLSIRNSDTFLQSDVSKYWVHDYYFAAISSGSIQDAILKYESHWKDWVGTAEYQEYWTWADDFEPHAYFISDMSLFINSVNNFDTAYVLFSSLKKQGSRFEAGIKEFYDYERNPQFEELLYIDDASKLQFSFDGDYLTIFLDEKEKVRLVGCDKEMFNFIRDSVQANECDLSKVTWPRRANGSCDYEDIAPVAASETAGMGESADALATERAEPTEETAFSESDSPNEETESTSGAAKQNAVLPILPIAAGGAALTILLAVVLLVAKKRKTGKE